MNDTERPTGAEVQGEAGQDGPTPMGPLRFAFYGRDASGENSEKVRAGQLAAARALVEPYGSIVAEYYDAGVSGLRSWADRHDALRLLQSIHAARDSEPGFDAVVVFDVARVSRREDEFEQVCAALDGAGIALWTVPSNGPLAVAPGGF